MSIINKTVEIVTGVNATKAKITRFDSIMDSNQDVIALNVHFDSYVNQEHAESGIIAKSPSERIELKDEEGNWSDGWSVSMDDSQTLSWIESKIQDQV